VDQEASGLDLLEVGDSDAGKLARRNPLSETEGEQEQVAVAGQPGRPPTGECDEVQLPPRFRCQKRPACATLEFDVIL